MLAVPDPAGAEPAPAGSGTQRPDQASLPDPSRPAIEITLVTGDLVSLRGPVGGPYQVDVEPAPRTGGPAPAFLTQVRPDGVYAIPSDAAADILAGRLDHELFNVSYLVEHGYGDAETDQLPVIVSYPGPTGGAARGFAPAAASLATRTDRLPATATAVGLASINGAGVSVEKGQAERFWQAVSAGGDRPARIWLDRTAELVLDESVPLVGAPQAWDTGFDGTGVSVAVLDSGVDLNHPDLAGQVVAAESFVEGSPPQDRHGHGTHVASTIAGTGAAADGRYTGVAPGADLYSGRVCNDGGQCEFSSMIAGMEWAATEMDADVVSMSLGGEITDGTDPLSQAVNTLTAETGTLFVIAAGNNGQDMTVGAPGAADAALTVAATDKSDGLAGFSSRGPRFGDFALKPDIAAPGVDIVAARAEGTAIGTPVDDSYTAANGTSMATPHVSGAAAILVQQHPDWSPAQLKAALMSTATDAGHTVYEQGAGRLDVARAVRQRLHSSTANLDFGLVELSEDGEPGPGPVTRQLTYANQGDQPVTLTLAPQLANTSGDPVPSGGLSTDATVTVPAGGTATAVVTLDPADLGEGTYTGAVVATDDTTGTRLSTPVGLVREPPMFMLTVHTVGRDGQPLSPFAQDTLRVDGAGRMITDVSLTAEGTVQARVPAGIYSIAQAARWVDADSRDNQAILLNPEVTVAADTELTLDLRQAEQITFTTPTPAEPLNNWVHHGYTRSTETGQRLEGQLMSDSWSRLWATPTDPVTVGEFGFHSQWLLGKSEVHLSVPGPDPLALHPAAPQHGTSGGTGVLERHQNSHPGWEPFTGTQRLPLVDVGQGTADELAGLDLDGGLALLEAGAAFDNPFGPRLCGIDIVVIQAVRDAGAAGIVAYPAAADASPCGATPIPLRIVQEPFTGPFKDIRIPNVALPRQEALALRDRRAGGPVTVRVEGTTETPYTYVLKPFHDDRVPDSLHYTFTRRDLAQVDHEFHAAETTGFEEYRIIERRGDLMATTSELSSWEPPSFTGPRTRREYVGPLSPELLHEHYLVSGWPDADDLGKPWAREGGSRQMRMDVFDRIVHTRQQWNLVPMTPGSVVASEAVESVPDPQAPEPMQLAVCSLCRTNNIFFPYLTMVTGGMDNQLHTPTPAPGEVGFWDFDFRLYRDGNEIPMTLLGGGWPTFTMPEAPGTYRLTAQAPGTETEWTFRSSAPIEDTHWPGYECAQWGIIGLPEEPCQPQPVVFASYDLGESLAMDNTVNAPRRQTFDVSAYHSASTVPMPEIAGARVWVSYGDDEWTPARVIPRGDGRFEATVFHPPARARVSDQVSLKVEAWDEDGNRIAQITRDAFTLR